MARTYRVRGIPLEWDADRLRAFLEAENNSPANTPLVGSLAHEIHRRSQTATISFPSGSELPNRQVRLPASNSLSRPQFITIDDDFLGITTLYMPPSQHHRVDVIALSGLGGHAFGSFKERGGDHMWIRDALPYDLTVGNAESSGIGRVMIYGYDSAVKNSNSFQNLEDLAICFHNSLLALIDVTDSTIGKPIIFVAHSLGGLILKQMLILLSKSEGDGHSRFLKSIYGIAFFGVPHDGMDITSLIPMATDNPNRPLVESLSRINPQIIPMLRRDFHHTLGEKNDSEVIYFYETRESPTAQEDAEGEWRMNGPNAVLVTKASATHGRYWEDGPDHICAIDRTHSDMVKFGPQDHEYDKVLQRLLGVVRRALLAPQRRARNPHANTHMQAGE
ncbi:hypothetical protein B0I35DRAFT_451334 [Stachybotrys elegans]|uniref:DUF676 domain-containing protein n=1 Tax=Stachybotrys elegans TaxID=80388 RepID=A0A8K0SRH4_9HYPO|nr:hypothetical protein B0I35DRAFT_451334 [Stachybotrys elegans]